MAKSQEFAAKLGRVASWLAQHELDGAVLSRCDSFAWLGCGASNVVNAAQETGVGALVVTAEGVRLVANNIETERLLSEELDGLDLLGAETFPWHRPADRDAVLGQLSAGGRFAADDGSAGLAALPEDFVKLRYALTPAEVERYRALGGDLAWAIEAAAGSVEGGMTEADAASVLALGCRQVGIVPVVLLAAADDRITSWRHPVVKDTPAEQCLMLVVCGRRAGLVGAVTRMVHFGELPEELAARHRAVCNVDAAVIAATRPGRPIPELFAEAQEAYRRAGFPEEWQLHHQGGAIGYLPREYIAHPACEEVVQAEQAFAWNPSIRGTKSEDTVLVHAEGFEALTAPSGEWPVLEVPAGEATLARADILVR